MTGAGAEGEWTVMTSRVDLLSRINDADRRYSQMFEALNGVIRDGLAGQKESAVVALVPVREALIQARTENDKRFDDLRKESDARHTTLTAKLDALSSQVSASDAANMTLAVNNRDRRAGSNVIATWIFGGFGLLVGLAVMIASIKTAVKP
jgi:hypothetical protein